MSETELQQFEVSNIDNHSREMLHTVAKDTNKNTAARLPDVHRCMRTRKKWSSEKRATSSGKVAPVQTEGARCGGGGAAAVLPTSRRASRHAGVCAHAKSPHPPLCTEGSLLTLTGVDRRRRRSALVHRRCWGGGMSHYFIS